MDLRAWWTALVLLACFHETREEGPSTFRCTNNDLVQLGKSKVSALQKCGQRRPVIRSQADVAGGG